MATIASFLEHKTYVESNNLKHKLKNQLYKDIYKLYSESIFADIYINVENNVIKSHRCILQTRVPTFYSTYCNRPDLINCVPVSKLRIFIREVYNESEIREQEEEILKCIDSVFTHTSSASTSTSEPDSIDSKQRLLQDLSKVNALNATHVSRLYFRSNSDNSVYYSLVDRSLVLSDYSDINEETPDMSGCREQATTPTVKVSDISKNPASYDVEEVICDRDCAVEPSCPSEQSSKSDSNVKTEVGKGFKCFIDASDLIDEEDVESREVSLKSMSQFDAIPDSLNDESNPEMSQRLPIVAPTDDLSELTGPYELVDDSEQKCAPIRRDIVSSSSERGKELCSSGKLESLVMNETLNNKVFSTNECDDTKPTRKVVPTSPDTTSITNNVCSETVSDFEELTHLEISSSTEPENAQKSFFRFKTHLRVKYECAKSNHSYSDADLESLKVFDEILSNDPKFQFLKRNLDEILLLESPSKTEVALHKFLTKQYEKKYGVEKTSSYTNSLMSDLLKQRSLAMDVVDGTDNDDLFKKLLSPNTFDSKLTNRKFEPLKESVTNSKSCGFFIDLKDNSKPAAEPQLKEKSPLPPKQLFSMFIDFGNSTDSDSSIEVQNKFERRKKQYMSKIEKSRELRSSVTSLSDVLPEKTVPVASKAHLEVAKVDNDVVRRSKNQTSKSNELRRSWNVDKTCELNQSTMTRHKRSFSVTEQNPSLESVTSIPPQPNDDLPSIGNADSTNELTINGESEISNSTSYTEREEVESKPKSSSLTSKTYSKSSQSSKASVEKAKEKTFVRLSDLDKEPKSLTSVEPWPSIRMTKSVTGIESNWLETKLLNNSVNSRSLSRIFPDLSVSVLSKTNSDVDDTTVSSISSVHSSSVVSTCESNQELSSSTNKADNHTLGQDLLRMFLDEISTDVVVEVAGRRIKAHKCILTSRCQYFAALLSGGWVESAGNVLSIHGFSYNVVHFALRYIYSGESDIPDNINIIELATLADYLCLEGLKEIVSSTLKTKYCHFFHKPCNVCSVGVLECLPIAINYGLDDLHRKSLRWITKHYARLWCTKAFASLPWELIDKCYNQHAINMTVNNVFETIMNCDKLFSVIPQTRWAEPCFVITKKLHDFCIKYLANHFVEFLKSDSFTSIACNRTWGIVIMDEKAQHVCAKMRSDLLCQSYAYISEQYKLATATHENEELIELLSRVKNQIETTLVKTALQASQCNAWFQMDPELRSHIQTSAGLTFIPSEAKRRSETLKPRQSLVASSGSRTVDLAQVKSAISRQHRQNNVRASEPRELRPSENQRQAAVPHRSSSFRQNGVQNKENKAYCNSTSNSSRSPYRNKYANIKSRYMDRKNEKSDKTASETTPSETSEVEKTSSSCKRSSKSLVSSVHLSPAIRQTVRAVSLSKIPVSVRTSSQKRNESDRDTTSGSDSGARNNRRKMNGLDNEKAGSVRNAKKMVTSAQGSGPSSRATQSATMRKSYSGSGRTRNVEEKPSSRSSSRSYTKTTQSASAKMRTSTNGARSTTSDQNGHVRNDCVTKEKNGLPTKTRSKDSSPDTKCPSDPSSKNSLSDDVLVVEIPRKPDIPFRRDGTFCIDEPTVLKKHTASSDNADV